MKKSAFLNKLVLKSIVLVILTATATISYSQEENSGAKKLWGGFGYSAISGEQVNIGSLNSALSTNGYSQLNTITASYGGGGAFVIHNFVIGGNGAWLIGSGSKNSGNEARISGGYGFFNAGYIVYSGKHGILYPSLGVGGGGYDIGFSKQNANTDFNQQLNAPAGMLTANSGGFMTKIQISYQYFSTKTTLQGFYMGLTAGYKYSPTAWNVSMNDQQLTNSPKINMDGLFVTLYLGGGSLTKFNLKNK